MAIVGQLVIGRPKVAAAVGHCIEGQTGAHRAHGAPRDLTATVRASSIEVGSIEPWAGNDVL